MRTNIDLMNSLVPAKNITETLIKALSARAVTMATPLPINEMAFSKAPDPTDIFNIAYHTAAILQFAEFVCELNTLEYSLALTVRKKCDEQVTRKRATLRA